MEKAIISVELYRKDGWRIAAAAKGFNGGLSALLKSFGGEEISSSVSDTNCISASQKQESKTEDELTQKVMGKISLSSQYNIPHIIFIIRKGQIC